MRIEDRITSHSPEHWVLFALDAYEKQHEGEYVDAETLYKRTGELFPSAEWIHENFIELVTRGLAETKPQGFRIRSSGSVAVKRHPKPDEKPWVKIQPPDLSDTLHDEDEGLQMTTSIEDLIPNRPWIRTDRRRVYWTDDGAAGIGYSAMLDTAEALVNQLPGEYEVVVSVGPYRSYDVAYATDVSREVVLLDYYSVRPNVSQWHDRLINAIHRGVLEDRKWRVDEQVTEVEPDV